jgi:sugar phosphate isomerase/epimerase
MLAINETLCRPYPYQRLETWRRGEGNGQIKELLAELAAMNYEGYLTMEPHLKAGGQFGGDTGPELFSKAIAAVRQLADEVGLKCE